jgi:hypothetical protein
MMRKEVDKKIKKEPHRHVEYENLFVKLCQIKLQQAYAAINVLVEMVTLVCFLLTIIGHEP